MDTDMKRQLAHTDDIGLAACAIRLRAARIMSGLNQKELARRAGVKHTTLNAMETAVSYPNRVVMQYLYREHRVDFNFLMAGVYAQLPGDVQDPLFLALVTANSEWDQKEHSSSSRISMRNKPA